MTWKIILFRFIGLVALSIVGGFLYALTAHLMISTQMMPDTIGDQPYGKVLTFRASSIWMASIVIGFIAIFIKDNWRWILYLAPFYAPSLFALIHTLVQPEVISSQ